MWKGGTVNASVTTAVVAKVFLLAWLEVSKVTIHPSWSKLGLLTKDKHHLKGLDLVNKEKQILKASIAAAA